MRRVTGRIGDHTLSHPEPKAQDLRLHKSFHYAQLRVTAHQTAKLNLNRFLLSSVTGANKSSHNISRTAQPNPEPKSSIVPSAPSSFMSGSDVEIFITVFHKQMILDGHEFPVWASS